MKFWLGWSMLVAVGAMGTETPFWKAVKEGKANLVRDYLLAEPLRRDERDSDGLPAVQVAAARGHLAVLKALDAAGANLYQPSPMNVSILHKGVYSGELEVVRYLLDRGVPVSAVSPSNGNTPLHDAIYFRAPAGESLIQLLVSRGADLDFKNRAGLTPVESAKAVGYVSAERLLESASHHGPAGRSLLEAVRRNDVAAAKAILAKTREGLPERNEEGFTPLILAARNGWAPMAELLLQSGADPGQTDLWMGANAGHKAAYWGRSALIPLLVRYRWNPNERGLYNGYTALHDAVARGHVDSVRELLKAGARFDIEGHDGTTPRSLAQRLGDPRVLALFP